MATATVSIDERTHDSDGQRFLLRSIDWQTYRKISEALTGRHVRLTYDRGNLELMTIWGRHGNSSRLLGRFVLVLAEEFGLPIRSFGDMTCEREDLERGIEPDESFYLVSEPLIRDKEDIDLCSDPPPDLGLEIDISRTSRYRMRVYADLRVPEVWQYDGETVRVYQLDVNGQYLITDRSRYFPAIPI